MSAASMRSKRRIRQTRRTRRAPGTRGMPRARSTRPRPPTELDSPRQIFWPAREAFAWSRSPDHSSTSECASPVTARKSVGFRALPSRLRACQDGVWHFGCSCPPRAYAPVHEQADHQYRERAELSALQPGCSSGFDDLRVGNGRAFLDPATVSWRGHRSRIRRGRHCAMARPSFTLAEVPLKTSPSSRCYLRILTNSPA